jgi:glycosyltransferase involved in cell wall biosynthesis/O-antigen/teichoic acid export membrane protein
VSVLAVVKWAGRRAGVAVRQSIWALIGQGANSIGNLLVAVAVARVATPTEFGVFSLVLAVYLLALGASRASVSTPLLLSTAHGAPDAMRPEVEGSLGASLLIGIALGVPAVAAGLALNGLASTLTVVIGLALPCLLAQDAVRYAFMARKSARSSAVCDIGWLLLQVVLTIGLAWSGQGTPRAYMAAWALSGLAAACAGLAALRTLPRLTAGWRFLVSHRRLLPNLVGDFAAANVLTQLLPYAVALAAGVAAAGAIRGALVLLGVVNVVVLGITPIAQLEASKLHRTAPERDDTFFAGLVSALTGVALAYAVVLPVLPDSVGRALLGQTWQTTSTLLLPMAIYLVTRAPYTAAQISLWARMRLKAALRLRIATAPWLLILPTAGAAWAGAQGAAWGFAVAGVVEGALSILMVRTPARATTASRAKPRVAALMDYFTPGYKAGGPVTTVKNMIAETAAELDWWVLTRDRDLGDTVPFAHVTARAWVNRDDHRVNYIGQGRLTDTWHLVKELRGLRPDIVYVNSIMSRFASLLPLLALRLGFVPGSQVVVAPRGELMPSALSFKSGRKRVFLVLWRAAGLHRMAVFQASSADEAETVRRQLGSRARTFVSADSVPPTQLRIRPSALPDRPLRLVQVARMNRMKNADGVLRALQSVEADVLFDLYGPVEDERYWRECQHLITLLPSRVRVQHRGELAPSDVLPTLRGYHASVLCSLSENFGQVVAESLSVGVPVIVSRRVPWAAVVNAQAGWVVEPRDDASVTAAISDASRRTREDWAALGLGCHQALQTWRNRESGMPAVQMLRTVLGDTSDRRVQRLAATTIGKG